MISAGVTAGCREPTYYDRMPRGHRQANSNNDNINNKNNSCSNSNITSNNSNTSIIVMLVIHRQA